MIIQDFKLPAGQQPKQTFQLTPHQKMLLMPIGDVHAFSDGWPEQRFRDHIQWGVDRGAYFIGMGEYLDFTSTTQRLILKDLRDSQKQHLDRLIGGDVERLGRLMAPSKGRWLGMLEGHHYHEYVDGTTSDQHLCRLLGAPFLGTSTLVSVRLNEAGRRGQHDRGCEILIFAHHGATRGGTRKQGGKLHRLEDLLGWIEADIYLMGHDHSKVNAPLDRLYRTREGHLYHRTKILARTGGWTVGYEGKRLQDGPAARSRGSYVEQGAMGPTCLGAPVFSLGIKRLGGTHSAKRRDVFVPDLHYSV